MEELGVRGDAVLIAEPCGVTRDWECLPLVSRGFGAVCFTVHGTAMHSSVSDRLPCVNASLVAAVLMLHLQERLVLRCPDRPAYRSGPTFVVGTTLSGGQGLAAVPGRVEFTVNLRTVPGMAREGVAKDIEACLADFGAAHPEADVTWDFIAGNLAWTTPTEICPEQPLVTALCEAAEAVLAAVRRVLEPLGVSWDDPTAALRAEVFSHYDAAETSPEHPLTEGLLRAAQKFAPAAGLTTFPGGCDARHFVNRYGVPAVVFGPGTLAAAHAVDEALAVEELLAAARMLACFIADWCGTLG